jgi:LDH2 family malate/lactate/ureidoglycolate dehydrogenase
LFLLLDPNQFAGAEHFLREVTGLGTNVRTCPLADGATEIQLPGDPERREAARRRKGIPLDDGTWGQLRKKAMALRVDMPTRV